MILRHAMTLVACARVAQAFQGPTLAAPPRRTVPLRSSTADAATGLADTQLVLKFACFGFKDRDCLLTLGSGGTATFSAGMVSDGPGEWRVVAGDPEDGIRDPLWSRGLGDVYKRQESWRVAGSWLRAAWAIALQ